MCLRAALLSLVLLASPAARAEGAGSGASDAARGGARTDPETKQPSRESVPTGADPARRKDRDEEVIAHLEELERLELLQHLELFDTAASRRPGR